VAISRSPQAKAKLNRAATELKPLLLHHKQQAIQTDLVSFDCHRSLLTMEYHQTIAAATNTDPIVANLQKADVTTNIPKQQTTYSN
jgi:hypothetical protein